MLDFAFEREQLGELVARVDAAAARAGIGRELLADAEAVSVSRAHARASSFSDTCLPSTSHAVEDSARMTSSDCDCASSARTFVWSVTRQVRSVPNTCVSPAWAPSCIALAATSIFSPANFVETRTPPVV